MGAIDFWTDDSRWAPKYDLKERSVYLLFINCCQVGCSNVTGIWDELCYGTTGCTGYLLSLCRKQLIKRKVKELANLPRSWVLSSQFSHHRNFLLQSRFINNFRNGAMLLAASMVPATHKTWYIQYRTYLRIFKPLRACLLARNEYIEMV